MLGKLPMKPYIKAGEGSLWSHLNELSRAAFSPVRIAGFHKINQAAELGGEVWLDSSDRRFSRAMRRRSMAAR
jgi:hypothetical protein